MANVISDTRVVNDCDGFHADIQIDHTENTVTTFMTIAKRNGSHETEVALTKDDLRHLVKTFQAIIDE